MNSRLTEDRKVSGVIVKHGETEIECHDDAEAIETIKRLGYTEADVFNPDGTFYHISGNSSVEEK